MLDRVLNLDTHALPPHKTTDYKHQERKTFNCLFLKAGSGGAPDNVT